MMIVQYDMPGASEQTMQAISQVRSLCNQRCFLAGFSVLIKDTKDLVDQELPVYSCWPWCSPSSPCPLPWTPGSSLWPSL